MTLRRSSILASILATLGLLPEAAAGDIANDYQQSDALEPFEAWSTEHGLIGRDAARIAVGVFRNTRIDCSSCHEMTPGSGFFSDVMKCPDCGADSLRNPLDEFEQNRVSGRRPAAEVEPEPDSNIGSVPLDGELPVIKDLGRWELVAEAGAGAAGHVYRAWHPILRRYTAVKLLHAMHDRVRTGFLQEARICAALDHPNIVRVTDFGGPARAPWMQMEWIDGRTVRDIIDQEGPMAVEAVIELGLQCARGLAAAHAFGVVHRDIKPSNLMVTDSGDLKITDFGLARVATLSNRITRAGTIMGTPLYMSPEQITDAEATERSDIYSLGATLFTMVTGRPPLDVANLGHALFAQVTVPIPPPSKFAEVPPAFDDLIARMCAKKPDQRPEGMVDIESALLRVWREVARHDTGHIRMIRIGRRMQSNGWLAVESECQTAFPLGDVQLNFAECEHVSSTGMGMLVRIQDEATAVGRQVVLTSVNQRVMMQFDVMGMQDFFTFLSLP